MRDSIEHWMVAMLALSIGCTAPPSEVTYNDDGSSGAPPPGSTGAGSTMGPVLDDSTTAATSDASGVTGSSSSSSGSSMESSSGSTGSEGSSSSGSGDSTTGEPMDEPLGPWGAIEPATMLNSPGSDDDPTLTADLLEIYFGSNRNGTEDVFVSTRANTGAPWDVPLPVDTFNSGAIETFPEVSPDGLVMLFASDREAAFDLDVYWSQRAARGQPWSTPLPLTGAATVGLPDYGATPTPDMTRVLLCRDDVGGAGQSDIWMATADFTSWTVGVPMHVDELATNVAECSSTLSPSEREIFFETTRPTGFGWSIWTAAREDPTGAWEAPTEVVELDGGFDEIDPWLSPDRRTLWYASGTMGTYDLYVATRAPE